METKEVFGNLEVVSFKLIWEVYNFCLNCKNTNKNFFESPKFKSPDDVECFFQLQICEVSGHVTFCVSTSRGSFRPRINIKVINTENALILEDSTIMHPSYSERRPDENGKWKYYYQMMHNCSIKDWKNVKAIECDVIEPSMINRFATKKQDEKTDEDIILPRVEDDNAVLLNDSKFSDVSLRSEGQVIKVHKCILASRSAVFTAMFNTDMMENRANIVEITDIKYDVLMEMIRYIYCKKVNNIEQLAGELAIAADKYALNDLKITCENAMKKNLNCDNVIKNYLFAEQLRMDNLKEKTMEFIIENANDIIRRPEFNLLPDNMRKTFCCVAKKFKK